MNIDTNGSYIREPSVSEQALKQRIEYLIGSVPLNEKTVVERTVHFDEVNQDIDFFRSKKELEASIDHQIDTFAKVTLRYNPAWRVFDVRELTFGLPGTSSLTAKLTLDSDAGEYSSYLYASDADQQIARNPVQVSTITTLLAKAGFSTKVAATTQNELLAELFETAQLDDELTITQEAVLIRTELPGDVAGVCTIDRVQTYSADEITDVVHFVNEVQTPDSLHARVLTVINSQHGSTILGEEVNEDSLTHTSTKRSLTFDYETIEKMLSHVNLAIAEVEKPKN